MTDRESDIAALRSAYGYNVRGAALCVDRAAAGEASATLRVATAHATLAVARPVCTIESAGPGSVGRVGGNCAFCGEEKIDLMLLNGERVCRPCAHWDQ